MKKRNLMRSKVFTACILALSLTVPVAAEERDENGYAWYDDNGDVWYWNGTEDVYIGTGEEYHIEGTDYYKSNYSGLDDPELNDYIVADQGSELLWGSEDDYWDDDEEYWDADEAYWDDDYYGMWYDPMLITVVNGEKEQYVFEGSAVNAETLAEGLSEITGLNFSIESTELEEGILISWKDDSTVLAGLNESTPSDAMTFKLEDDAKWTMLDSLMETIRYNLEYANIWYTDMEGNPLKVGDVEFSALPYFGSDFYKEFPEKTETIEKPEQAEKVLSVYLSDLLAEEGELTFKEEGKAEEAEIYIFELSSEYYSEKLAVSKDGLLYVENPESGSFELIIPLDYSENYDWDADEYIDDEYWEDDVYETDDEYGEDEEYWDDEYWEDEYEDGELLEEDEMDDEISVNALITPVFTGLQILDTQNYGEDGYYYSSLTEDGLTTIIHACILSDIMEEDMTIEDYIRMQLTAMEGGVPAEFKVEENKELTEKFTYPVYVISWSGEEEEPYEVMGMFLTTDGYDYVYQLCATGEAMDDFESFAMDTFNRVEMP